MNKLGLAHEVLDLAHKFFGGWKAQKLVGIVGNIQKFVGKVHNRPTGLAHENMDLAHEKNGPCPTNTLQV